MAPLSPTHPIHALRVLYGDARAKDGEAERSRCASLLVLLCPCLTLLTILLIVASIFIVVKLRLYCRGPFHSLAHAFFKTRCDS